MLLVLWQTAVPKLQEVTDSTVMPKNIHDFNALRHLNNNNLITSTNIIQTCMPHMGTDDDVTLLYIINGLPRLKAVLAQRNAKPEKDKEERKRKRVFSQHLALAILLSPHISSSLILPKSLLCSGVAEMTCCCVTQCLSIKGPILNLKTNKRAQHSPKLSLLVFYFNYSQNDEHLSL